MTNKSDAKGIVIVLITNVCIFCWNFRNKTEIVKKSLQVRFVHFFSWKCSSHNDNIDAFSRVFYLLRHSHQIFWSKHLTWADSGHVVCINFTSLIKIGYPILLIFLLLNLDWEFRSIDQLSQLRGDEGVDHAERNMTRTWVIQFVTCELWLNKIKCSRHILFEIFLPVEIIEEWEEVECELDPSLPLALVQRVRVHDARRVVQPGAAHHRPIHVPEGEEKRNIFSNSHLMLSLQGDPSRWWKPPVDLDFGSSVILSGH